MNQENSEEPDITILGTITVTSGIISATGHPVNGVHIEGVASLREALGMMEMAKDDVKDWFAGNTDGEDKEL